MCQPNSNNDMKNIPAAACPRCGGWTGFGGMSQHSQRTTPVDGRTGCDMPNPPVPGLAGLTEDEVMKS